VGPLVVSAVLALLQGAASAVPPKDTVPPRAGVDSQAADLAAGRADVERVDAYRAGARRDSSWARAVRDTADAVLDRAAAGTSARADSARVWRVELWAAWAALAWEAGGLSQGPEVWGPLPAELHLSPVLEELGENLLRACPTGGVLLTSRGGDYAAAWYMRFARGLRPDVLVTPLSAWREDAWFRARAARDLRLGRVGEGDDWLARLLARRPVCVSMALDRPSKGKWRAWPLVWAAGPHLKNDGVPARDFVFAALALGLAAHDPWADQAVVLYGRAARATPSLCDALRTFAVAGWTSACHR